MNPQKRPKFQVPLDDAKSTQTPLVKPVNPLENSCKDPESRVQPWKQCLLIPRSTNASRSEGKGLGACSAQGLERRAEELQGSDCGAQDLM